MDRSTSKPLEVKCAEASASATPRLCTRTKREAPSGRLFLGRTRSPTCRGTASSFASNFPVTHFAVSKIAGSMKPGHRFKQRTNPYLSKRSALIGRPLGSLSPAPLHATHEGAVIHHTANLLCHFSPGWRSRAWGHIDLIRNMKLRLQKWFVWLLSIIALISMAGGVEDLGGIDNWEMSPLKLGVFAFPPFLVSACCAT